MQTTTHHNMLKANEQMRTPHQPLCIVESQHFFQGTLQVAYNCLTHRLSKGVSVNSYKKLGRFDFSIFFLSEKKKSINRNSDGFFMHLSLAS